MSEWKECKLGDLVSIKGGFSYKGEHLGKGTTFLLGMGCVSFSDTFLKTGARPYNGDTPDSFLVSPGDIVLATRQQSDNLPILGAPAIIPTEFANERVIVGTNLYQITNKSDVDNKFIFWLLKTPEYKNHIDSCAKGSTVKMITKDAVESFNFLCPSKKERETISGILWQIEDKINLLHRQNDTLEKMAETLFRQWFIEEPREEWEGTTLGHLIQPQKGKNITKDNAVEGEIPVIAGGLQPSYYHNEANTKAPVITISASGANAGYVQIHNSPVWSSDSSFIDGNITPYVYFFYIFLKLNQEIIYDKQEGSAIPHIYPSHLMELEILNYPLSEIEKYNSFVRPFFDKVKASREQIRTLTSFRDMLLPKLMSGEIKVM